MVIAIAAGGALGRYGVDTLVERRTLSVFPFGTFVVNVTGCFVIGLAVAALVDRHHTPHWLRAGAVVGVLGAYTTFSTFAQETLDLGRGDEIAVACANVALSVGVGRRRSRRERRSGVCSKRPVPNLVWNEVGARA